MERYELRLEEGRVLRQCWEVSPMCGNIAAVLLFSK